MRRRQKGLSFYHKRKKISSAAVREGFSWFFGILVSIFIAYVFIYFAGMTTGMIGVSMEPALYNGEKILVNKLCYMIQGPKTGEVIVFLPNGNENAHLYVKRVVGVPGDTVQIIGGRLYVNGSLEETGGTYDKMADAGIAQNPVVLLDGEYFVLGDNRNNSEDSRSANIGPVKKKDIVGKAWFRLGKTIKAMGIIK